VIIKIAFLRTPEIKARPIASVKRLKTGQDVLKDGSVCRRGGTTEFLCRDQLLQVEQQALSQPAKGFDFCGYRLCGRCNVGKTEMKKRFRIGKLLF
jgi:hypothetical protein